MQRFFCSEAARERGETLYGTVARIRSWLLIEYPYAWRRNAIEDSRLFSDGVKQHIRSAVDRALLIRRDCEPKAALSCFFVEPCEPPSMNCTFIGSYEELATLPASGGSPASGILYAVCTHGKHDRCCARFGLPLYRALCEAAADRAWQCSHVGGDRFAGNVVVFPYGIYYGHVAPEDVPDLVRSTERGEIWLKGYRGRSCFSKAAQVADYFARRESGRLGIGEFRPQAVARSSGEVTVRLLAASDGSLHTVRYAEMRGGSSGLLTCEAAEPSPITRYDLLDYRHQALEERL
jgi:hypothetical protein